MKTCITAIGAPSALGPYNHAVEANGFLFVSGQVGVDPVSGELAEGVEAQAKQALKNAELILAAAGCSMADVVKCSVFLKNIGDFAAINDVYKNAFEKDFPARSCFEVANLPRNALFEVEIIAVKP